MEILKNNINNKLSAIIAQSIADRYAPGLAFAHNGFHSGFSFGALFLGADDEVSAQQFLVISHAWNRSGHGFRLADCCAVARQGKVRAEREQQQQSRTCRKLTIKARQHSKARSQTTSRWFDIPTASRRRVE